MTTTRKCEFCGAYLKPRVVELMGKSYSIGTIPCTCSESVIASDAKAKRDSESARREAKRNADMGLLKSGVPKRFLYASHEKADEVAQALLSGNNVWAFGAVGSTKTTLASASMRKLYESGNKSISMVTSIEILDEINDTYSFNSTSSPKNVSLKYSRYKVLVIDDLGKETATDASLSRLFDIINRRSNDLLPTMITTQYKPSELIARMARKGDEETTMAIVSRLRQDCFKVELVHGDMRMARGR